VAVAAYGTQGLAEALSLRTYSARLLGETIPVLCVKESGWDLATIEPPGHPALRLEPLKALDTDGGACEPGAWSARSGLNGLKAA
jgi:hypothetical protein